MPNSALADLLNVPDLHTYESLVALVPAQSVPVNTPAYTSDQGLLKSNGANWVSAISASSGSVNIISSADYGLIGDNATDNNAAIIAWIAAANALLAANVFIGVEMQLQPGYYRTSGLGYVIPGRATISFLGDARVRYTGSIFTAPVFTHGEPTINTIGNAIDVSVENFATHNFMNRNYIGWKALNRNNSYIRIKNLLGFTTGLQLAADNSCSYNTIDVAGAIGVCQTEIEVNCLVVGTAFISENNIRGGNVISTSSFNNHGSCFGLAVTREFDTGYVGNSGNYWYKPSMQLATFGLSWTASTVLTANRRYYAPLTGTEWLCKTGGTSGTVQPSIEPTIAAGTRVDVTPITTTALSAVITMASTTGISAGWHMRGMNPLSNFPFNTYVLSVDSGTQLTMTEPAASSSTTYRAHFIAPTTDNAATLIYVGPYRRSLLWHRNSGATNGIYDTRDEGGVGEQFLISGAYLWPQQAPTVPSFTSTITSQGHSRTPVPDVRMALWLANTAYVSGDMTRPTLMAGYYWECLVGGTSHATAEPTMVLAAGTTTVDNGVTWIVKAVPIAGVTRGDYGNYSGFMASPSAVIRDVQQVGEGSTASVVNAHMRGIGSATGWLVQGFNKLTGGSTMGASFAAGDFKLAADGLLFGAVVQIGFLVRTDQQRCFRYNKVLGTYKRHRGHLVPFDKGFLKTDMRTTHSAINPKISNGTMTITGGFSLADTSDAAVESDTFLVGNDVPYVWIDAGLGSTGTPVACTFSGIEITALPYYGYPSTPSPRAEVFTLHGAQEGPRASLGTPTSGFFKEVGEYIRNDSYFSGATPKGYFVKTAGILVPAWATSTVVVKNELKSAGGRVYKSNGSFTTGTTPSGTAQNFLDTTATAIVAGDVATWDDMGVVAVLDPAEDTNASFSAGNTGAAPAPNCQNGLLQSWTLSANTTWGVPTNAPRIGEMLTLLITSSGAFTTAWNAVYRNAPAWAVAANTQKATAVFCYDGTNWQFVGGSTAFA
jgi:hypothetical protein